MNLLTLNSLPDEIFIKILDNLTIEELLNFLLINKNIRDRIYPYYDREIKDEITDRNKAMIINDHKINKDINTAKFFYNYMGPPIFLNHKLGNFMSLNNFLSTDGKLIYNYFLAVDWWRIYIITNNLLIKRNSFKMDNAMKNIFSDYFLSHPDTDPNNAINRVTLLEMIKSNIDYRVPEYLFNDMYILSYLINEYKEIKLYIKIIRTKLNLKFGEFVL